MPRLVGANSLNRLLCDQGIHDSLDGPRRFVDADRDVGFRDLGIGMDQVEDDLLIVRKGGVDVDVGFPVLPQEFEKETIPFFPERPGNAAFVTELVHPLESRSRFLDVLAAEEDIEDERVPFEGRQIPLNEIVGGQVIGKGTRVINLDFARVDADFDFRKVLVIGMGEGVHDHLANGSFGDFRHIDPFSAADFGTPVDIVEDVAHGDADEIVDIAGKELEIRERDLVVRRVFREFETDFRVFAEEGVTSVFHDAVLQQIETRKEFFLVKRGHLEPAAFLRGDIEIVKRLVVEAIEGMARETFFPFRGIVGVEEEPFEFIGRHLSIFRAVSRKVFPSA